MRRLLLPVLLVLLIAALPARASANQCQGPPAGDNACSPDVVLPADPQGVGDPPTTGYIGFINGGRYPAYNFSGHYSSLDPGRFGNAFTFDGTDNDGLESDPGDPNAGGNPNDYQRFSPPVVTVAAWVKATNPGVARNIVVRGERNCGGVGAWGLETGSSGGLEFYAVLATVGTSVSRTPELPPSQIWDGNWHAIAGVYDRGTNGHSVTSLWVDGREVEAVDTPNASNVGLNYAGLSDEHLFIAREAGQCGLSPAGFAGSIDEVEIRHKALTATQMATLQSAGPTSPPDVPYAPDVQGPTISGTPKVGQTLTCADRDGMASQSYTWERAPRPTHFENDANWFAITGASGTHYTVQDADAGSRVRCHEYGTKSQNSTDFATDRASDALRTDTDVPQNIAPPHVTGIPAVPNILKCSTGTWANGPDESAFVYQWVKNGAIIPSNQADETTYGLSHTWNGDTLENTLGDGGTNITCRVIAKNDIGYSQPAVSPDVQRVVDGPPFRLKEPTVTLSRPAPDDFDPLHTIATCNPGSWRDDYVRLGVPGYQYRYQWYRTFENPPSQDAIPGATEAEYHPRVEDLGRGIRCRITVPNVSYEVSTFTQEARIGLPDGPVDSTTFREPGRNGADPTSLLALNDSYANPIEQSVIRHLNDGLAKARTDCRNGVGLKGKTVPSSAPGASKVPLTPAGNPLDPVLRCQILLHSPSGQLAVNYESGVRFRKPGCVPTVSGTTNLQGQVIHSLCPSLGIEIPSVNPTHPPTGGELGDLGEVQPKLILWDLDRDGATDAICPGTAPVLRTILEPNQWNARAVIITNETAKTGVYHFAQANFDSSVHYPAPKGKLRPNQVRVCSTSYDPPPDPAAAPCMTSADFGHVHLVGDLCPVAVRSLDPADYEDLLGSPEFAQLKAFMLAASEDQLKNEAGVTVTRSPGSSIPSSGHVTWADWPASPRDAASDAAKAVATTNANVQAALSAQGSPTGYDAPQLPHVENVPGLKDSNALFAFQQVLVTRKPVGINGVTQDPVNGTGALLVPSDVKNAIPNQDQMVLAGRDVASHLGLPSADGLPLATGGLLKSQLSDVPKNANDVIRETNIDQVKATLEKRGGQAAKNALEKLDLGPFKLSGAVKVHAENDGTATLEGNVTLPGLATSPTSKGDLTIAAKLHGGLDGRIALRGLHLHQNNAYLGALHLSNLGLDYDSDQGLTITGAILFPPNDDGLTIKKFQLGPNGQFRALDVDYKQTPGIMLGPGLFLSTLGGGLDLPKDTINAHAVLNAGPSAGGCAVATLDGQVLVYFGSPFAIDAVSDVALACIKFAKVKFHGDATGLFSLDADAHFPPPNVDLGPLYFDAHIGAAIRLQNRHSAWQVDAAGNGGIRDLLTGAVQAVLSNAGLAGCGSAEIEVPLIGKFLSLFSKKKKKVVIHLSGGASVDFVDDVPPLNIYQFLANLHLFTGCDIGSYRTVTRTATPRGVGKGGYAFTVPANAGATLFSIEGAGGTPLVRVHSPTGQTFDVTDALDKGKSFGSAAWGKVLRSENRTVIVVGDPAAGTWTAEPADGSPRVVRVRQAPVLPKPKVAGRVTGRGKRRTLSYNVTPVTGQVVHIFEMVKGGQQLLKTVNTGGSGKVRFTVAEASGTHRQIVAEVTQDHHPRANIVLARFVAPSPRVGKVRGLRVRRRGRTAVVTWHRTYLARSYVVSVRYGDGRNMPLRVNKGAHKVVVPGLGRRVGVRVTVRGVSAAGRLGPRAQATLGNLHVGYVRHLPPLKNKKRHTTKRKTTRTKRKALEARSHPAETKADRPRRVPAAAADPATE
jgi:hypothetical protein